MVCDVKQIDSNVTNLAFAVEECPGILPGVNGADAIWYNAEPNSYSDFGPDYTLTARSPITAKRSKVKGRITDRDAAAQFNTDVTPSNISRLMQGFLFTDGHTKENTHPEIRPQSEALKIESIAADGMTVSNVSALPRDTFLIPGRVVYMTGASNPANNGVRVILTADEVTQGTVKVQFIVPMVPETPNASMVWGPCGFSLPAKTQTLPATFTPYGNNGGFTLHMEGIRALLEMGQNVFLREGMWVFFGEDTPATSTKNIGYARLVAALDDDTMLFECASFTPQAETITTFDVTMYIAQSMRNEIDPALQVTRSYQFERQLGKDSSGSTQSEYVKGCFPNQLTLNTTTADKLNADLQFVALNGEQRTGAEGLKPGTRVAAPGEGFFSTSEDIYSARIYSATDDSDVIGYVTDFSIVINNNVSTNKAIGVVGAFGVSLGDFEVTGSATAYFQDTSAQKAIAMNEDISVTIIAAAMGRAMIFDMPLVALGGGRLTVEKDKAVMLPLTTNAAESKYGHTLLFASFPYIPKIGMASK